MSRTARKAPGGLVYHVINRGVGRQLPHSAFLRFGRRLIMDGIICPRRAGLASFAVAVLAVLLHPSLVAAGAPKVVKAEPDNGQEQVDPATKHIRIEFDQPMDTLHGYSIVGGGEQFPQMVGKPRWQGDRTIIISVKLEPDHDYRLSINSSRFTGFRGRSGEAAEPYPIAFSTAAGHASGPVVAAGSRDENQRAFEELRRAILTDYAYRDRMNIDWANVLDGARARLEEALTPAEFARRAARVLAPAQDMHLWLKVDGSTFEGKGIEPNVRVTAAGGFTRRDPILEAGLKELRGDRAENRTAGHRGR